MPNLPFEALSEAELRQRTSLKWRHYDPDVLPLWVAEMDVMLAPEVVEALSAVVRTGDTGYPGSRHAYAESYAEFAGRRWGWAPNPAETLMCSDVMGGIRVLIDALCPPGGPVVIPSPVYPPFTMVTRELGRTAVHVGLASQGRLDLVALESAMAAAGEGAVLLLCSPHNPTGAVHTAEELGVLAAAANRHGTHVIVDEVHAPLVPAQARFVPWLSVADSGFVVTSAAKAFNLAGLKAGLIVAGPGSRTSLRALPESVPHGASHLGVIGHCAGYRADPTWLDEVNANIASNRRRLTDLIAEHLPAVTYREPEATYLAWLDFRATSIVGDPAGAILKGARVALTAGAPFGPGGSGHARLNMACSAAMLERAVLGIARALGGERVE